MTATARASPPKMNDGRDACQRPAALGYYSNSCDCAGRRMRCQGRRSALAMRAGCLSVSGADFRSMRAAPLLREARYGA